MWIAFLPNEHFRQYPQYTVHCPKPCQCDCYSCYASVGDWAAGTKTAAETAETSAVAQQQGTRCFCFRIKYHQRYRIDAHGKTLWNAWSWLWGYLRWFEYATWATLLEDRVRKNSTRKCHTEILNSSNFNDCLALKERATLCLHSDGWHQLLEFPLLAARQRLLKRPMRGVLSELCYHRVLQLGTLISRTSTKWRFEILLWAEIHGQAHK